VVIIALVAGIAISYQRYREAAVSYAAVKAESDATRERYASAIDEIAAIQDSLNAIVVKGTGTALASSELEVERKLTETGGDRALARIAVIKAGIERAKSRIEQLGAGLRKSGIKLAGLQKMIDNLNQTVIEKEGLVAELTNKVDVLQTRVAGLSTEVETQAATIEDKRRELGTIYYVVANRKDLTSKGIVEAKGGLLGLGKTLKPSGQIDESLFTSMDTDQENVIHIPGAKAQVLSAQPVSSYELLPGGNEITLRILDPKEFRTVKHVVIMTG
jgi:chaperonin cofactor prefoldin